MRVHACMIATVMATAKEAAAGATMCLLSGQQGSLHMPACLASVAVYGMDRSAATRR